MLKRIFWTENFLTCRDDEIQKDIKGRLPKGIGYMTYKNMLGSRYDKDNIDDISSEDAMLVEHSPFPENDNGSLMYRVPSLTYYLICNESVYKECCEILEEKDFIEVPF